MPGCFRIAVVLLVAVFGPGAVQAGTPARAVPVVLKADDVIPTGNDWIALPAIRASDGALDQFNVLSMRYRGLLEASGPSGHPLIAPFVTVGGIRQSLAQPTWTLGGYWIPTGTVHDPRFDASITWVAPPEHRAAILRLRLTNRTSGPLDAGLGIDAAWGDLKRVTYAPAALHGRRTMRQAPWDRDVEVFQYASDDTVFSWALAYGDASATLHRDDPEPGLTAQKRTTLAPGETIEVHFILSVGIEEFGVGKTSTVVAKAIDRYGLDGLIARAEASAASRTRTTGEPDLDRVMNRNFLFTRYFAWGRTIDTEQFVGVTSRSNRYYVSAAYWDRDAMLWSFPGLLDTDQAAARDALDHALGVQGRNIGVHSRYIDGVVLEDGFQLDELVAPLIALASYVDQTGDTTLLKTYADVLVAIRERLDARRDGATGLYETFQDAQDEYIRKPFQIYDNALAWKAFGALAALDERAGDSAGAARSRASAEALKAAILKYGVGTPPGGTATVLASAVDGKAADFADVPPGSLMKLPLLGFMSEDDPLFRRTYTWLHGKYAWSYSDRRYGLPGSYRLPFTTSWGVADHLRLSAGRGRARAVLLASPWDGGIVTEGVNPDTAVPDQAGRAFATAAGYVAHAVCAVYCTDRGVTQPR